MKTLNGLLMAAAAVLTVNLAIATQAGEPSTLAKSPQNKAVLKSPRYLEEHPELLRGQSSGVESPALKSEQLTKVTENSALAHSPRFREEHPELRWAIASAEQSVAQRTSEKDRLRKLTENKASAASPRFREEHPELLRSETQIESAPLK